MNLSLNRIKMALRSRIEPRIATVAARYLGPGITARFLLLTMKRLDRQTDNGRAKYNLMVLPKPGFTEDALTSFGDDPDYALIPLERYLVKAVARAHPLVPYDDNSYITTDPETAAAKKELRTFWRNMFGIIRKKKNIHAVLTGSFWYASEQELAGAVVESGVPFISVHKECLKTPGLEEFFTVKYRQVKAPFQGSKILVYNEVEKRIQTRSGVFDPERIIVTGMPRLDPLYHNSAHQKSVGREKPIILFLHFGDKAGLPILGSKDLRWFRKLDEEDLERLSVEQLCRDCHRAILEIATENPDLEIVVKTKGDFISKTNIEKYLGGSGLPGNLKIQHGGDLAPLLFRARVAVGFNSTALLEAMVCGVPVVTPRFNESGEPDLQPYLLDLGSWAEYAGSAREFKQMILDPAQSSVGATGRIDPGSREQALDRWLGNADGQAGRRVRDAVLEEIVQFQQRKV